MCWHPAEASDLQIIKMYFNCGKGMNHFWISKLLVSSNILFCNALIRKLDFLISRKKAFIRTFVFDNMHIWKSPFNRLYEWANFTT